MNVSLKKETGMTYYLIWGKKDDFFFSSVQISVPFTV